MCWSQSGSSYVFTCIRMCCFLMSVILHCVPLFSIWEVISNSLWKRCDCFILWAGDYSIPRRILVCSCHSTSQFSALFSPALLSLNIIVLTCSGKARWFGGWGAEVTRFIFSFFGMGNHFCPSLGVDKNFYVGPERLESTWFLYGRTNMVFVW